MGLNSGNTPGQPVQQPVKQPVQQNQSNENEGGVLKSIFGSKK